MGAGGPGRGVSRWRAGAYGAGLLVVLLALVSPLDTQAQALFSAHMVQHLLLLLVAPPLLVAGAPLYVGFWALPGRRALGRWWRGSPRVRAVAGRLLSPLPVWATNVAVLWFWHLPVTYDLAVQQEAVHVFEHASFLATAFLFWWLLFRHTGRRMDQGRGVIYVFTAGLQCSMLGAILTFSGKAWYSVHAPSTAAWGLTPLQDQQLAGLIMWIPGGLVYLGAAAVLFLQWIERPGSRARPTPHDRALLSGTRSGRSEVASDSERVLQRVRSPGAVEPGQATVLGDG